LRVFAISKWWQSTPEHWNLATQPAKLNNFLSCVHTFADGVITFYPTVTGPQVSRNYRDCLGAGAE
jgi:hypothetical protein